ncbi:MAG: helix-turn-helix transcriptional regulator [Clostridia bacterium]|nr:helix-turn-helix transcriptional regulator [Clostridia bacterium]
MRVGEAIKKYRLERKMTQKQLADSIHFSVSYVSDIERNRTVPALKTLSLIADALDVEVSMIVRSRCCYQRLTERGEKQYSDFEICKSCPLNDFE